MRQLMFMAWVFGNYFFQVELISFSQHGMPQADFQPRYSRERLSLYQDDLNWLIFGQPNQFYLLVEALRLP